MGSTTQSVVGEVTVYIYWQLKNHGVPEEIRNAMFEKCNQFVGMPADDKEEFEKKKDVFDRIIYGSSNNLKSGNAGFWRDYMKLFVHPDFNSPHKPAAFREALLEYTTRERQVTEELLKGVSKSLGVDESYLHNVAERENGMDVWLVNIYPPCPQPELAVGLPPHTDFGLLILVSSNKVGGLQIQRNGNWYNVEAPTDHIMVIVGDQIEIITNGRYKSVSHRVGVNNETTRLSIVTNFGPSANKVVVPAPEFVDDSHPAAYRGTKYADYYFTYQTTSTKKSFYYALG